MNKFYILKTVILFVLLIGFGQNTTAQQILKKIITSENGDLDISLYSCANGRISHNIQGNNVWGSGFDNPKPPFLYDETTGVVYLFGNVEELGWSPVEDITVSNATL